MILWIIALVLLGSLAIVGFYQGAIRVAFSLVGLLLAALLAVPLGGLIKPLLPAFGMTHPVVVDFVAPAIIYLLVLIIFKSSALLVHKKLDTWMKYHASDTQRRLFERMSARVGICLGLVNAVVYLILISVVAYTLGYFTTQVASGGADGFWLRTLNSLNEDLSKSGLVRVAAHYSPAKEFYYDASDLLGDIYHNPLLQGRLSSYPPFLTMSENAEFKRLGDMEFQNFWQREKTIAQIQEHPQLKGMIESVEFYTNLVAMLGGNLTDLKTYFETGVSPKYEDDKILGRWKFNYPQSFAGTKRNKPTAGVNEINRIKKFLDALRSTSFLATVDNKATLRLAISGGEPRNISGTWKNSGAGSFDLRMVESGKPIDVPARADASRLSFAFMGYNFVFERLEK